MGASGDKATKIQVPVRKKPVPDTILNKVIKSICKITIKTKKEILYRSGFFMNTSDSKKYLMTNYHIIKPIVENENIEIEIHNKKKMKLKFENRFIKYIEKPKDIAMIEIKESDDLYKDIEFLDYDHKCITKEYSMYKNLDVFSVEYPYGDEVSCVSGRIINIYDYEFEHNIQIDNGSCRSSGCPIILLNNYINSLQVIGIVKEGNYSKKINGGTFIGEILDEELKMSENNNYIIAEIDIEDEDINENNRILNSYEEEMEHNENEMIDEYKNEDEIKQCEIRINDEIIPFNYYHRFKSKGKYIIKYSFKNYLNKTCSMFCGCYSLSKIDFSNFNTNKVTDMAGMFAECTSLTNIDFSNFNTNKVTNMAGMFNKCSSLTNIDLSNFNTKYVINMKRMFYECSSLTKINLSGFNTYYVTNMEDMFFGCSSLTNIDVSYFNTKNVFNMSGMFFSCSSLNNIDLSNFNTNNVTDMTEMIACCSSLSKIDLSNFNTNNVTSMRGIFRGCSSLTHIILSNFNTNENTDISNMFSGCSLLKKENVITKDERILNEI